MFDKIVEFVINEEGGYVNDPRDAGGETKYGISKRAYPKLNIKNLTKEQAKAIYHKDYWLPCKCDELDPLLARLVFDTAVNMGVKTSIKMLQKVCGVEQDGIIGKRTLSASKKPNVPVNFFIERIKRYTRLKTFPVYGRGWVNRTIRCYEGI